VSAPVRGPGAALPGGAAASDRIVPPGAQSARSVGVLAAILAFFAIVVLALAFAAGRLAESWSGELSQSATLQIFTDATDFEDQARAALNVLRTTPGVRSVRMIEVEEQRDLLEPWLGPEAALDGLPLPLLIDVVLNLEEFDRERLELRHAAVAPGAIFDDHSAWRAPLVVTAERLRVFALACLGLLALCVAAALSLAAHAAIAASGQVIETLRLVGARDAYVARAFTRRFTLHAGIGALLGTLLGLGLLALLPKASEPGFFLVGIGLTGWDWLWTLAVPVAVAGIAWLATARAVRRHLRKWS
jgi:cell division transport system permease protein